MTLFQSGFDAYFTWSEYFSRSIDLAQEESATQSPVIRSNPEADYRYWIKAGCFKISLFSEVHAQSSLQLFYCMMICKLVVRCHQNI